MPSDVELMQAIVRGQAKAFDVFFSRYRDAVRAHAAGMLRDESGAKDVVQEVFLRAWNPGPVFALAAFLGETDPLAEPELRLLVGLPGR